MYPRGHHGGRWETGGVATLLLISELDEDESTSSSGRFITGTYLVGGRACSDMSPMQRRIISWFFQEMNHDFTVVQTRSLVTTPTELSRYATLYLKLGYESNGEKNNLLVFPGNEPRFHDSANS